MSKLDGDGEGVPCESICMNEESLTLSMENPINKLTTFWREIFESNEPTLALEGKEGISFEPFAEKVELNAFPEPFYGYLDEDISGDAVLLLINPGQLQADNEFLHKYNSLVKDRFLEWSKEDYLNEEEKLGSLHPEAYRWRSRMKGKMERVLGEKIGFLHTIEYFPYHSHRWSLYRKKDKKLIHGLTSTRMAVDAIKWLTAQRSSKAIIGIGSGWVEILKAYGISESTEPVKLYKPGGKRPSHVIHQFKLGDKSPPLIIYRSGAGYPTLPSADKAIQEIRRILNI